MEESTGCSHWERAESLRSLTGRKERPLSKRLWIIRMVESRYSPVYRTLVSRMSWLSRRTLRMPAQTQSSQLLRTITRLVRTGSDRKSTRLNSSHSQISYAVFCLKKKKKKNNYQKYN